MKMTSGKASKPLQGIKAIDPSSVHRICSGQVIIDLSTAVKELIENSLDAGATTIDIRLKEYGSELIEVSDNGTGVAREDREVLMKKYYTSKLSSFDDLERISTFGFRGEALSSLCAMGHVSAITRVQGEECGVKLEFDTNGNMIRETLIARAIGTTISVQDLFHSLPVRHREFKKNVKRDYSKLVSLLHAYSLVQTSVRFVCTNQVGNGTVRSMVLSTQHNTCAAGDDLLDLESTKRSARVLFGKKVADQLIPMMQENKELGVKIEGLVSGTGTGSGCSKGSSKFFYVNKRPIQFMKAGSVLNETYKSFISPAQTQKPICILNFRIDTNKYDVNVTPDKRKVFFHHELEICQFLQECLASAWDAQRSTFIVQKVIESKSSQYVDKRIDHMFTPQAQTETVKEVSQGKPAVPESRDEHIILKPKEHITEPIVTSSHKGKRKTSASLFDYSIGTLSEGPLKSSHDGKGSKDEEQCPVEKNQTEIEMNTPSSPRMNLKYLEGEEAREANGQVPNGMTIANKAKESPPDDLDNDGPGEIPRAGEAKNSVGIDPDEIIELDLEDGNEEGGTGVLDQETEMQLSSEDNVVCESDQKKCNQDVIGKDTDQHGNFNSDSIPCDIDEVRSAVLERARVICSRKSRDKSKKIPFEIASMTKQPDSLQGPESEEIELKARDELQRVFHKENFEKLHIIGQFNLGFIIAKLGDDLFIIDQHASDEKFTFENLQRNTKFKKQRLIKPIELQLSPREEELIKQNFGTFSNSGFEFQESSDGGLNVVSVPHCKGMTFGSSDILEMIDMIERGERSLWHLEASSIGQGKEEGIHAVYPPRFKALLASKACRTSIMIGKPLDHKKMKEIVSNLSTLVSPWNCPHGRPTMRHLAYIPTKLGNGS